MSIITLRPWTGADIDRIARVWMAEDTIGSGPGDGSPYPDSARRMNQWLVQRQRERATIGYVAESGADFAGFVLGRVTIWESEPPILVPRKAALIDALFVEPGFRRTGIGAKLVDRVVDRCRKSGIQTIEVGIEPGAAAAGALWKRLGFVPYLTRARRRERQ